MTHYEYLTGMIDDTVRKPLSVTIAKRAGEGWRLVSCQYVAPDKYFLVMERPRQAITEKET